jgi:hypothetical protein
MDKQVPTTLSPRKFTFQDVFSIEAAWGLWSYYVSRLVAVVVLSLLVLRLAGVECGLDFGTAETRARAEARRARLEEEEGEEEEEEDEEYASRGVELTTLDEEADEGSDHDDALLMAANIEGRGCREWGEAGRAGISGAGVEEAGDEGGRRKRDA